MDELLEIFLSESRELVEKASKALLALEKNPKDEENLNTVFRSTHTLKSSSAMFDFDAMNQLMHRSEDMLDLVRQQRLQIDSQMIDYLLDALDLVSQWLDFVEAREGFPENAELDSAELLKIISAYCQAGTEGEAAEQPAETEQAVAEPVTQQAAEPQDQAAASVSETAAAEPGLAEEVVEAFALDSLDELFKFADAGDSQLVIVRYTPNSRCFFDGDDPFDYMQKLPGLLKMAIQPSAPWAKLDDMDVFNCQLKFIAVSDADQSQLNKYLHPVKSQIEMQLLGATQQTASQPQQSGEADAVTNPTVTTPVSKEPNNHELKSRQQSFDYVVKQQIELLNVPSEPMLWQGIIKSAALVTTNSMKSLGKLQQIAAVEEALKDSISQHNSRPLIECLNSLLSEEHEVAVEQEPMSAAQPTDEVVPSGKAEPDKGKLKLSRTLTIDQERIDQMMDLVGELIVAKNSLPYLAKRAEEEFKNITLSKEIKEKFSTFEHITEALQRSIMQVRMLPVSQIFKRMPRAVRDLSRELNKKVELSLQGEETEADKNIIELLFEPLQHLVRNSIDHGIESPEERAQLGKAEAGQLTIRAWQSSDTVYLEVEDDGRGINPQKIRDKLTSLGHLPEDKIASLTDDEVVQYVFMAGVTTARQVSDISGRGVGLDVVNNMVDQLGGRVSLSSEPGEGTAVTLSLPLSVAISRIMTFSVHDQHYGFPIESVIETMRLPLSQVQYIKQTATFSWRQQTIPLLSLSDVLELNRPIEPDGDGQVALLVIKHRGDEVGVIVNDFHGGMDLIIKPLEGVLAGMHCYGGTGLLGDGSVLLVLNPRELF